MALCRRGRLSIFRGEEGSGGKSQANASPLKIEYNLSRHGPVALCRRGRLSIFRGEEGSAALTQAR